MLHESTHHKGMTGPMPASLTVSLSVVSEKKKTVIDGYFPHHCQK